MSENIHRMVIRETIIDFNYVVDIDENGMMNGMTQHHGLQHQSSHSHNFIRSNSLDLVWYPYLPISYAQAPLPSTNVSSLEENTRMGLQRRRHHHRFLHRQYRAQEIEGHSNFHPYVTASPYRVPETTNHSRSSSMHMQTKSYLLPENLGDQEYDICIICQDGYKNKEEIGILQCGHKYHAKCIKRWLYEKNVCPICKSKGLTNDDDDHDHDDDDDEEEEDDDDDDDHDDDDDEEEEEDDDDDDDDNDEEDDDDDDNDDEDDDDEEEEEEDDDEEDDDDDDNDDDDNNDDEDEDDDDDDDDDEEEDEEEDDDDDDENIIF